MLSRPPPFLGFMRFTVPAMTESREHVRSSGWTIERSVFITIIPRVRDTALMGWGGGKESQAYRALSCPTHCVVSCRRQKASRVWYAHETGQKGNELSKSFPSSPAQRRPHRVRFPPLFNATSRIPLVSMYELTALSWGAARAWPAVWKVVDMGRCPDRNMIASDSEY